ncbi:hypothetical protein P8629_04415 [Hydrogenovibrio sp. 3SP14C1]|uniref:hypothetical protein n=1 Tax=Hydrogenovibrio sp. 3SP14C1 TaxID=3038774 RepID=UPI002416234D|nr:hypothetical protein [Hydrogenovibrio sp. 3SP14C1]MDG4812242.1 hypothetical protein [Hydrogenovibrio sp. 3SP14C1]
MKKLGLFLQSDLFLLAFGKLIQVLLLFAAVRIFTTNLSVNEVGNLILMLAVATFFGLALINPVGSFLNRKLNEWLQQGTMLQHFIIFNFYVLFVSFIAFLTPFALIYLNIGSTVTTIYFSIAVSLFVFFNTWNQTLIPSLNLLFYRKAFIFFTLLSTVLYLALASFFILSYNSSAFWWLVGQAAGLGIGFLLALMFFLRFVARSESISLPSFNIRDVGNIARFTVPLSIATLLLWSLGNFYKLIVEAEISAEALAYIGLGLTLAVSLAGAVESLMMQVFHAHFYKGLSDAQTQKDREKVFQAFISNTMPMVTGALFVLMCLSPYLVNILADQRFSSVYIFLMFGVVIELIKIFTNILSHAAHSEYKTHKNIMPYFWGSLIGVSGVFVAMRIDEWQAGVVATLITAWLVSFIIMKKSSQRLLSFNIPWKEIIKVVLYLMPVAVISVFFKNWEQDILLSILIILVSGVFAAMVLFRQYNKSEPNAV